METIRPHLSRPGEGTPLPLLGLLKASAVHSGGTFEVIEYHGPLQPPPHVHRGREEAFYILEGTFRFVLGDQQHEAPAGSLIVIPRGVRHGFVADSGARALLFVAPAGLGGFFEELGTGLSSGKSSAETRAALADRYDSYPAETP
jgi:mannose-6-phosphate isomerase-like protein (cupin superfamily)